MGYPYRLKFTRCFTKGNLKGSIHDDSIGYPTVELCHEWVKIINEKHKKGKLDYFVQSYSVEKVNV